MQRKVILVSMLGMVGLVLLVAISTVTVLALAGSYANPTAVEEAAEIVPLQAEPVSHQELVKPALEYQRTGYAGKSGCSYSAKMQLTEAPAKQALEEPLAQIQP